MLISVPGLLMQYSRNNDPNQRLLSAYVLDRAYDLAQPFKPDTLICIILLLFVLLIGIII
jgi:hypothetical protein